MSILVPVKISVLAYRGSKTECHLSISVISEQIVKLDLNNI